MSEFNNNRERALSLIKEGSYTRKSLCEVMDVKPASLASVFSQLRLMGYYPMEDDEHTLYIGTQEEYEAKRADRGTAKAPRTPEEIFLAAQKRENRAYGALDKAEKAMVAKGNREAELRLAVAKAEVALAEHLMEKAEQACVAAGIDITTIDAPNVADPSAEDEYVE